MNGVPLHPMIVHFPMVLVFLLPIFALGALWAIRRGALPVRAWSLPLAFAVALAASAFVATKTGEQEEDRAEQAVPEAALHAHEEAAERFLLLSGVLVLLVGAGLAPGLLGRSARLAGTVGAIALVFAGVQVGKAGGELVYRYDAGSAYAGASSLETGTAAAEADEDDD